MRGKGCGEMRTWFVECRSASIVIMVVVQYRWLNACYVVIVIVAIRCNEGLSGEC